MERWLLSVEGPESFQAKTRLISVLIDEGKVERAQALLSGMRCSNDDACKAILLLRSHLLRKEKKFQEAYHLLSDALQKAPNDQDLLYERAMIAESMDQLDKMEQDLHKIMAIYPDSAMAYNALGYTLADRGIRLDEALKLILKAYQLSPEEPAILDSLGWVYYRMGVILKRPKYFYVKLTSVSLMLRSPLIWASSYGKWARKKKLKPFGTKHC